MTRRERIDAAVTLREPDRTPILGGWIACPPYIVELAGATNADYEADPLAVTIRAYEELGSDGLLSAFVPRHLDEYRCVDHDTYSKADRGLSIEEVMASIDAMPTPERVETGFDFAAAYEPYRANLVAMQERCGEMVWMPAQWGSAARLSFYGQFGYENWYLLFALSPDRARKMLEVGSAHGHCHSLLLAKAVEEGLYPKGVLLGEDITDQRGPMVPVDWLDKYYLPLLKRGLEPIRAAGCRPVWHSDGNVMPMVELLLEAGVQGFQGYQPECGVTLEKLVELRTREGEPLLLFGPLAVTTELPKMTPDQVVARIREAQELCRGRASLIIFTSNTICPDVPLANIRAMHEAVGAGG